MTSCFVGKITIFEQFKVLDAILQTKSLFVLPFLSFAILTKNREELLHLTKASSIKKWLRRLNKIDIFELLLNVSCEPVTKNKNVDKSKFNDKEFMDLKNCEKTKDNYSFLDFVQKN